MTTVTSQLVTSNILQLTLLQTNLQQNFIVIGEQLDRLGRMQNELEERINGKVEMLEEKMYMELGSINVEEEERPVEQVKTMEPPKVEVDAFPQQELFAEAPKRLSVQKQKQSTPRQSRVSEVGAEIQKQLSRLQHQLEQERSRIDELEEQLHRQTTYQAKTNKKLDIENEPPTAKQPSSYTKNNSDEKRFLMVSSKLESDMSTMQLQINLIQKQLKQQVLRKEADQKNMPEVGSLKPQKSDKVKEEEQVKEEIVVEESVEPQEPPAKPPMEAFKEILDGLAFKVGRLDSESIKVFKHINTLNADRQRHEDQLVSIVQKIKKNEGVVATDIKELQQRVELLMTKKALRQEKLLVGRDPNQTNSSMLVNGQQDKDDIIIDAKRLEQIMMELEDLKDEIMGMREKEEARKLAEQQKDPSAVAATANTQAPQKLNYSILDAAVGTLRRDLNSVRYQLQILKSKDEITQQIAAECEGKPNLPTRPPENRQQWKEISIKLQKVRSELLGYIKQMDLKLNERDQTAQQLREVESLVNQNKILLNKKADRQEIQKLVKKLQTRLNNFIKQSIEQEELATTHDARVARQPWFCLSCDNQLKTYSGKQGKYLPKDLLPIKKLNTQNHMVRRSIKDASQQK